MWKREKRLIVFSNNFIFTQAMSALNEFAFAEQDSSNVIRSRPAYLMGVLRKYRSGRIGLNFMAGNFMQVMNVCLTYTYICNGVI